MSVKNMQIVDVKQRSPEWFELRKTKITATDACVIMGCGFKSIDQLYHEKTSGWDTTPMINEAMQRGIDLEPVALQGFNEIHGLNVSPKVCVRDWQMASMDGLSEDCKIAVEVKCPGLKVHTIAVNGQVPNYYKPQLQHQMYVCDLPMMYYVSYFEGRGVTLYVERDDDYISKMVEREEEFYECMQSRTLPVVYENRDDYNWKSTAYQYHEIRNQMRILEEKERRFKSELLLMAGGKNVEGYGIRVKQIERKGNINYSKIPELQGVDIEKYRSPSVKYAKIS